jgi:Zn-dependent protease with chaperone function
MINIKAYITTKEKVYLTLCCIVSGAYWLIALFLPVYVYKILAVSYFPKSLATIPLAVIIAFLLMHWMTREFFKAHIFGNSIRVNEMQFSEVYKIALEMAKKMGVEKVPYIFIVNEEGRMNAWAIRYIGHAYVVLYASLVDLMLKRNAIKELRAVIAHELAHHAAGHVNVWSGIFLEPAMRTPFLGKAYRRACVLTADRLALVVTGDLQSTQRALISLACGSESMSSKTNIVSFMNQEVEFLLFFGFLREIFATHPRITKRVICLENYGKSAQIYAYDSHTETVAGWRISAVSGPLAGSAIELTTTPIVIGRDPKECNLIINAVGGNISRRHCMVRFGGDGTNILLEDLGSKNGTFLNNGRRLEPGMPQPLQSGERFYLTQPDILFELQRK